MFCNSVAVDIYGTSNKLLDITLIMYDTLCSYAQEFPKKLLIFLNF